MWFSWGLYTSKQAQIRSGSCCHWGGILEISITLDGINKWSSSPKNGRWISSYLNAISDNGQKPHSGESSPPPGPGLPVPTRPSLLPPFLVWALHAVIHTSNAQTKREGPRDYRKWIDHYQFAHNRAEPYLRYRMGRHYRGVNSDSISFWTILYVLVDKVGRWYKFHSCGCWRVWRGVLVWVWQVDR